MTNVVRDLIAAGLVEQLEVRGQSGGRPADLLCFNAARGLIFAVEITSTALLFLLTDLNGDSLVVDQTELRGLKTTPAEICRLISQRLTSMLRGQKRSRADLLITVIGVPAIVNTVEGSVLAISTLDGWRSVPLRKLLSLQLPGLVLVDNDINLAAQGERLKGAAQGKDDFVLISIDAGLGAGIIMRGEIYHGFRWSAGEIGYLRLPGAAKSFPKIHEFGEVEAAISGAGLLQAWRRKNSGSARGSEPVDGAEVLDRAQAGEANAVKIVIDRAATVSDVIVNVSLILNPALIVLGGRIGQHPFLLQAVRERLNQSEFGVERVESGHLGQMATRWGAVAVALAAVPDVLLPYAD